MTSPFHLAFPVKDLEATRQFYRELIGCKTGRESDRWIDFDFFGNQITAHLKPEEVQAVSTNAVDGEAVPVRHFGAILEWQQWHDMARRLKEKQINFVIEPYIRFEGQPGEQATMFFYDPSGNALEFKSFKDASRIFAT
ncbi:VOC family protein [Fulvivirgaceae bacterium BMA12]|uniref:VOC family protein n=1 Tax=Agaribacillus aureus TaxID=3051825 RepID=A0ABT8LG13_9BACT|nr:VOC family protein [Fulvivirgaceae bacterium BMA12]